MSVCVYLWVYVCVWQERKPEKSVVRPKLSERSLNLQPFRTHTPSHTHIHPPPPQPRGTWTLCRGRELELAGGQVAGLVLHLQTGEIYLALAGQKQGREHTETQKEAWYAVVSHSVPQLTWEKTGAVPRETPSPLSFLLQSPLPLSWSHSSQSLASSLCFFVYLLETGVSDEE